MTQTLPLWKNGKEDEQLDNHVLSDDDIEEPAPDTMINRQTESSVSDRPQRTRTIPKRFDDYVLATTNETIPKDYEEAIACEDKKHWENAMLEEIQNMYSHQVWELVPRPVNAKVVKSKWVFKISKDQENKTYKARLVAMGYNQIPGRDYNESFSPVIKNATLRTILSMAATKDSVIKLFDVKAAYLNGNIENTIFMEQPAGFVQDRNKVCKLNKSIYGLPQSGRSWYEKFSQVLHDCGLEKLKSDPCLFKWKNEDKYFYVGIYVDDFITVSDSEDTSNRFINKLRHHLEIKDVTCKGMFLGIKIIQDKEGISLQQSHYVQQILQKYGMENCKEVPTPGSKEINLDNHIEDDNCEQHTYQEALGMLMFLAVNTRPDIAYNTSKLSQYSRQPKQMHWTAIKRVMRYLRGTIDLGVKFERGKTGILKSYTDASWSTTHDGKSHGGYVLKLGEATIDWKSSKQPLVALSTMEAEMIAACESCCQIKWIINLLQELEEWNFMEKPTAIYTDSQSLINWISSPKQSSRCRHINRKYHFLRDCYESRDICLLHKPSQDLEADIFTKDLSRDQMKKHLESLCIVGIKTNTRSTGNDNHATQKDGESIDSFITELKGLSTSCEFESQKDSLIRDRIVYGIQDKALQERLLREPNLTLLKAIEMCKTDEISKQQIKIMQNNQNICQIRKYEKKHSPKQNQESEKEFKCQRCGKSHRAKNCPAWGKRCSKCKKMNHFAAFCKSSAIRSLNDETEETVWSIHEAKVIHTLEWKKSIIVNGKEICFKLDSGAEVNVLPYTFTRQMKGLEIFQTNRKLTSYTGHEIKIKGIATLNCKTKNKTESLEFFIADGYYQPILGIEAIEKLSLIKKCDAVQTEQNNSAKEILNRHKNIFEGIGRLPIEHKIRLKENATPVIAPSRKIPFSIREKVKAELERMEKLDIIEKVEEPSEWTHPIVVVQKPSGDVRICMDPRELNKYVQRERYILPTAETIFSELKGATVFSVFDASSAFWQVPLDKESTNLCTIATPFGRFRFKRLPYGLNSASEVFQRCINNILSGLQGTACYMDDILIYGNTMEEHNRNLETVLRRLEENNIKLNAKKQQIAVNKVNFLGHIISRDGIAIQASRAEAIQKLKRPENKTEVQRFLGMVTYLGKFIPNLSDKTAPLRKLISNKSEWKFGGEENDCFEKLKNMVSNAPILTFFDPTKPITISSDASQYGIGTVLMQGGQAIEYASFSLNATQRKYAQIEKELLAIVFGCERFQYYIWGNDVIVETDHKPLLSIVKKPLEKLSPRLQRMVLRLMRFQISLKFTPGKNMFVADHLSRDPLKDEVDTSYLEGQTESVHMLLVTTDEKIKRLQKETHGDHTLIQLIEYAKNGWPKYKTMVCDEAKPYWQFQDEIHVSDGIVYKGNCIMVPSTLRKEILQVVHSSHQGIAASKVKARSAFYWPGMITQVENEVEKCRTCQEYSRKNPEESRIAHEIPEFPWEKIAVDFMEVSGTSSILVVDYHSKFVEIRKLSSKRETETILQLKTIFRTHGIPRTLVSDNGPPFNSTGFKNFAQKYEFKHQTSSPKYPRSNGQVERTIQTIKGLIIKAVKSGRDPNLALMEFNNTPKYDLPSPTQMLMGRSVRTLSTYTRQQLKPLFDTTKNYQKLRDHQQKYAGSPKRILRPLEVGDNIMLQERHRKWVPATVTAKHETPRSYMVKTPSGSEYRRNRSHLRPRKFSVEDSAPTSQSPSIPGSQAGTAMDDNIQDHGRPTSENRRAYDPRENVAKKGEESSTSPSVRIRSGRTVRKPLRYRD
ncbi:K02A2.6-like [Cordylochernes scorpioides]|uniref:RNA-directed DNA polymerase n=1 Tax=Cordylochernes scorpioides TaxID=51811 RepID=A0ABY6LHA2_9ARAC|nr:K02A2.6-like [Cordylochernes scorpioides]